MGAFRSRVTQVFTGGNGSGGTPFAEHAGLYLLHCHNLEHEDAGMMLNLEVS
jgi:hypothetical protein